MRYIKLLGGMVVGLAGHVLFLSPSRHLSARCCSGLEPLCRNSLEYWPGLDYLGWAVQEPEMGRLGPQ